MTDDWFLLIEKLIRVYCTPNKNAFELLEEVMTEICLAVEDESRSRIEEAMQNYSEEF